MFKKRNHSLLFMACIALLVFALVGCTEKDEDTTKDAQSTSSDSKYPIEIKHALGTTIIEEQPKRVATIAWANHDVALALGVVPVGFSAANYGVQDESGLLPWTAEKLAALGESKPNVFQDTDGLDFEAIADSNPDVILAAYSGITAEEYETLSQIAPVVAYPETPWVITWRDQILYNAKGMGLEEEGKKLVADTEKLIADTAKKFPEIKGKKAAFGMFSATDLSKFYVYTPTDPRGEFLLELGMEFPAGLQSLVKEDSGFYLELSAENADALQDTELFIAYGDDTTLATLQADPILGKVPAIQNGSVLIIEDNTPLAAAGNPNPLSINYTVEEYVTLISEAVKKIK